VHQRNDEPVWHLQMDRLRLQQLGLNAANVAQNVLVSLSGSYQTSPAHWLNPGNGVVYQLTAQTPQHEMGSIDALMRTPVDSPGAGGAPQLLGNLVNLQRESEPAVVSRYNTSAAVDVYADVAGRDLGAVRDEVDAVLQALGPKLPRGVQVTLRGQAKTLDEAFVRLAEGFSIALVLVFLLIAVTFQSWRDASIIVVSLTAALAGIAWALFLGGTSLSVPALVGTIMTLGMGTANGILVLAFARRRLSEGARPLRAALQAGATRLRPVLMTASAMIVGLVPMALGLGAGGEQNAPLGRAAIGGIVGATLATLFLLPALFALVHRAPRARTASGSPHV
jgi:multidrug efflux pump subunit AcrB